MWNQPEPVANIVYNAFVRQFKRSKQSNFDDADLSSLIKTLDEKGYTVIPESGKFRDLKNNTSDSFWK